MFITYPAIFIRIKTNEGYTVVFPDLEYGATEGRNEMKPSKWHKIILLKLLYEDYLENNAFPKSSRLDETTVS